MWNKHFTTLEYIKRKDKVADACSLCFVMKMLLLTEEFASFLCHFKPLVESSIYSDLHE